MTAPSTTILNAELDGAVVDVRVDGELIAAVGPGLDRAGSAVVDARGGALLPGLHDHHIHLLALAAADRSLALGDARDPGSFDRAIQEAHRLAGPGAWIRGVGWEEAVHGPLDRHRLDQLAPGRAVRIQHRSGAVWVLSTVALAELDLEDERHAGIERDPSGAPSGHLHRLDALLAARMPHTPPPDLGAVGARLAAYGVTGVTDATPYGDAGSFEVLAAARRSGALPQRVVVTGGPAIAGAPAPDGLRLGPVKVLVADNDLPTIDDLVTAYRTARRAGRAVAVHCVSTIGLVLALAAWDEVGPVDGDRVEHGSVIPIELVGRLRELGLTVVTQPGFIADRGDRYQRDVDPADLPGLYRCRSLLLAGVPVGGSTDAPFGPADPWVAIRTAIDRRTASGAVLGADEAVEPRRALGLFLGEPDRPGGPERTIEPGAPADLCLLAVPLAEALADPSADHVCATWIDGTLVTGA